MCEVTDLALMHMDGRWEAVVEALSRERVDYVERHFRVFSRCMTAACHPACWVSDNQSTTARASLYARGSTGGCDVSYPVLE